MTPGEWFGTALTHGEMLLVMLGWLIAAVTISGAGVVSRRRDRAELVRLRELQRAAYGHVDSQVHRDRLKP